MSLRSITRKSRWLVAAQFACIGILLFGGSWRLPVWAWALFGAGLLLFAWAAWALGSVNFTVFPEPTTLNLMRRRGPYRSVRHPMYTAVLLCGLAFAAGAPNVLRAIAWGCCVAVLVTKVKHEEGLLTERYPEYPERMKGTGRLVPFLWTS